MGLGLGNIQIYVFGTWFQASKPEFGLVLVKIRFLVRTFLWKKLDGFFCCFFLLTLAKSKKIFSRNQRRNEFLAFFPSRNIYLALYPTRINLLRIVLPYSVQQSIPSLTLDKNQTRVDGQQYQRLSNGKVTMYGYHHDIFLEISNQLVFKTKLSGDLGTAQTLKSIYSEKFFMKYFLTIFFLHFSFKASYLVFHVFAVL